jgi:outer membrane protein assembly factor BamB
MKNRLRKGSILLLMPAIFLCFALSVPGEAKMQSVDWPQFRGPNGSGVNETSNLPLYFGNDKNVIWKTTLPPGHSSPVLTEEFIFVTAIENESLLTICLYRRDGKILWRKKAPRPRQQKIDDRNNPASPSPVTDGERVFVFFADYGMLAYNLSGNEIWRLPLGPFDNQYGMGASPILAEGNVILVCDQNGNSYIVAADKKSGKIVWKTERPEAKSGHSTPIVYTSGSGETQVLVPGSFLLSAYSARTGIKIWWVGGLSFEMKSTPVIQDDVLFINGYATPLNQPDKQVKIPPFSQALSKYDANRDGKMDKEELPKEQPYGWFSFVDINGDGLLDSEDWNYFEAALASLNGMLAIRLGGHGDMSQSNYVWQYRRSVPQLPSPLLYKNVLYMINDGGTIPVAADDKVFIISRRGKVSVLGPGGDLDVMASNDLKEQCFATPAIAEGRIYLRTVKALYCFGLK